VPLAIRGPGFDGGGSLRQMVSLIDLPPTLLNAAGIDVPDTFQGRSILPLVSERSTDWPDDVYVEISESMCGRALRTGRWKYGVHAPDTKASVGHADKYVEQFLYDLQSDPYELKNLLGIQSHEPVAKKMRERLLKRMTEIGLPPCEIVPAAWETKAGQRYVTQQEIDS
jgi:arylsulfatase A-like enzyme